MSLVTRWGGGGAIGGVDDCAVLESVGEVEAVLLLLVSVVVFFLRFFFPSPLPIVISPLLKGCRVLVL